jgi:hypothetical protein
VPKYDAFGREIGEDPLAALGWSTKEANAEEPARAGQPARAEEPPRAARAEEPARAPRTEPPRPAPSRPPATTPSIAIRRRPRVVSRLIVLAIVAGAVGLFAADSKREIHDALPGPSGTGGPPAVAGKPPVGLRGGSLIRPAELGRALDRLRAEQLGRLTNLRLAPERIDAQFVTSGGRLRLVQLGFDGEVQRFPLSGPGFRHLDTIPLSKLDPTAPARLVRAAAARLHRPAARIDYVVASRFAGTVTWGAYFKAGGIFLGDARGRLQRRIS